MDESDASGRDEGGDDHSAFSAAEEEGRPPVRAPRRSQRQINQPDATAWLAPDKPALVGIDGKYIRPKGRAPVEGYSWNNVRGVWVPGSRLQQSMEDMARMEQSMRARMPKRRSKTSKEQSRKRKAPPPGSQEREGSSRANKKKPNGGEKRKRRPASVAQLPRSGDQNHNEWWTFPRGGDGRFLPRAERSLAIEDGSMGSDDSTKYGWWDDIPYHEAVQMNVPQGSVATKTKKSRSANARPRQRRRSVEEKGAAAASVHQQDSAEMPIQDSSKRDAKRKAAPPPAAPYDPYHPNSYWKEPRPLDYESELTLYERHRKPRPAPTGHVLCSVKAVQDEISCVICLGYIRNARIVRECLHRFCEECIEKALTQLGRRKECPICRIIIPSRRSLDPDPHFDKLVQSFVECMPAEEEEPLHQTLQRAIQNKKISSAEAMYAAHKEAKDVEEEDEFSLSSDNDSGSPRYSTSSNENENGNRMQLQQEPKLVKLVLRRDEREKNLDDLQVPYLTLSGDAPITVLCRFLEQKLDIRSNAATAASSLGILSFRNGRRHCWRGSTRLDSVVAVSDKDDETISYTPLYYRNVIRR